MMIRLLVLIATAGRLWAAAPAPRTHPPGKPATPPIATARVDFERQLRVQVFLDRERFCPGQVDGRGGEFTRKAVAAWNVAHGIDDVDDWQPVTAAAARRIATLYAAYKIKPADLTYVTPDLPTQPEQQVKAAYLGYRSLAELVAERFHTNEALLARLNPATPLATLRPGTILRVPNVDPFVIEKLTPHRSWNQDPALSRRTVLVNVDHKTAAIYNEAGELMAFFPITPGQPKFVPRGEWKIEVMVATPPFRWDKQMLEQGQRGTSAFLLPPGPNSPVGILWAGLNRSGIGLHGTATPESIGRSQSHGCIRLSNWDAVRLPSLLRPGARVIVK